jgi:tol-pal system protein YbgF
MSKKTVVRTTDIFRFPLFFSSSFFFISPRIFFTFSIFLFCFLSITTMQAIAAPNLISSPQQPVNNLVSQFDFAQPQPTQTVVSNDPSQQQVGTSSRRGAVSAGPSESLAIPSPNVISDESFKAVQQPLVSNNSRNSNDNNDNKGISQSGSNLEILSQMQEMQETIQQLRGQVETQAHVIAELQKNSAAEISQKNDKAHIRYAPEERKLPEQTTITAHSMAEAAAPSTAQVPPLEKAILPEQTIPTQASTSAPHTQPAPATVEEELVFNAAFTEVKAKDYAQAIHDMEMFVKDFPQSKNTPEAYYWLGEMYLITGDEKKAEAAFMMVTENFPHSYKAPESLLKLALLAYEKGDFEMAKKHFRTVVQDFSDSSSASFAQKRLEQMIIAGH